MENMVILLFWACLAVLVILFIMGISNKVVIFDNLGDFFFSCGPVYLAFTVIIIFDSLTIPPLEAPIESLDTIIKIITYDTSTIVTSISGVLAILGCLVISLRSSIRNNGVLLGTLVFVFKFLSSVLLSLLIIAKFKELINEKSTFATRFAAVVLLGVFSWMMNALVNGEKVRLKRLETEISHEAHPNG